MAEISKKKKVASVYITFYYKLFKLASRIFSLILVITIILGVVIIIAEKAKLGGFSVYVVESESMEPTLKKGDAVIIQRQDSYVEKDIVTFYPNEGANKTYTHRIVAIDSKSQPPIYKTRGDNNLADDQFKVTHASIQGKVVQTVPAAGGFVLFLRSVSGILLFIIIPATMLLTLNLQSIHHWLKGFYNDNRAY